MDTLFLLVDSECAVVRDHCMMLRHKAKALNDELRAKKDTCRWVLFNPCQFDLEVFDADELAAAEREENEE